MPTTANDVRELLHRRSREDTLRQMSPERRTQYERIMKLRKEIGPVNIDVSQILREMRGG